MALAFNGESDVLFSCIAIGSLGSPGRGLCGRCGTQPYDLLQRADHDLGAAYGVVFQGQRLPTTRSGREMSSRRVVSALYETAVGGHGGVRTA